MKMIILGAAGLKVNHLGISNDFDIQITQTQIQVSSRNTQRNFLILSPTQVMYFST